MKIILAQGNPESKYDNTRHNVGFAVIDEFAESHNLQWSEKSKFSALIAETTIDDEKVILVKPTTYYNETGQSARRLIDFYSVMPAHDLLVIHDDLALPFGTIRTRGQGSDAGNNGVKSLNNHIGPDYHRIRIGIANDLRERMGDMDFVLGKFSRDESEALDKLMPEIFGFIADFIEGTLAHETKTL
ncbi:MAG: pth, peptidyl-tRNA hydrolase [Candidatus Saccharibacteria bacterium]|nr:pth, peptidyl-tRNA hydrolase [Candidatus Saccharibacteria bacterium]